MQNGARGMMVHYLNEIADRDGTRDRDWDETVAAFDVDAFADGVQQTGSSWLIFTIGQNAGRYLSPNPVIEKLVPGACTKRNLVREIAEAVTSRGIRFLAYMPTEMWSAPAATVFEVRGRMERCDSYSQ